MHAEKPGVSKEYIQIKIDGSVVSVNTETRHLGSQKANNSVLRSERYYDALSCSFELPQEVDVENAKAEYKYGNLYLTLPKKTRQEIQRRLTVN